MQAMLSHIQVEASHNSEMTMWSSPDRVYHEWRNDKEPAMPTSITAGRVQFDPIVLSGRGILYLAIAGLSLVIPLRLMRHALAPIGALVQAVVAAAAVALAVTTALVLLVAVLAGLE